MTKEANDSERGAPYFAQPKAKAKTNRIRFLSDFWNLKRQLKHNPYTIKRIREMLLNIEGFQYATLLDLNRGYYHIGLSKEASKLCTIIFP